MKWKKDFFVGYSPERINPGDKQHTLTSITKVVSGYTPETLKTVAQIYGSVVKAGVHKASSIKVAEAAKVIENIQRDLNIALVNEFSLTFHRIGIDTPEVLQAAGTTWNFLPCRPGCRRINDGMGKYIAEQTVKQMIQSGASVKGGDVIVLGLTHRPTKRRRRHSAIRFHHAVTKYLNELNAQVFHRCTAVYAVVIPR